MDADAGKGHSSRMLPDRSDLLAVLGISAVALSPMAMIPGGLFRFALPKLLVVVIGVGLAAWAAPAGRLPRLVSGLVAGGALVLVLSATVSAAPLAQVLGRWPRYEGLIGLPIYVGALWTGARLLGPSSSTRRLRSLESALSVTALAVGVIAAFEALGFRPLGGDAARPGSMLGNATDQGIVGMVILSVLLLPAHRCRRRLVILGALAAGLAIVLSGSRAALLGAVVALVLIGCSEITRGPGAARWRFRWARARTPLLAAALIAAASVTVPATRHRVLGEGWAGATVDGRLLLWSDTWRLSLQHLWTGVGPSGFVDAIAAGHSESWALRVGSTNPPDSPHAWPLQVLVAGGFPLLAICLALVTVLLVRIARAWRAAHQTPGPGSKQPDPLHSGDLAIGSIAAAAGYGVALLTQFTTPGTTPLAALLVGGLIAGPVSLAPLRRRPQPSRDAETTARPAVVVVTVFAGAWAVALCLGIAAELKLASAVGHAAAGETVAAESDFATAGRLRPWDRDVSLIAAQAYYPGTISGDPASAENAAHWSKSALEATPGSIEAGRIRGFSLGKIGNMKDGRRILDSIVRRAPLDTDVRLAAGVLAAQSGDTSAAKEDFLVAVHYNPGDPIGWQDLAILYRYLGRDTDAAAAQLTADRLTASMSK